MSAAREITLATGRGRLAALRSGDPKGPKLLALHGWLDNAASFEPLLPELADVDLVALDLAGHGASEHRATGYDYVYADWVHDVIDVLDSLGWERADLLGHSMGATIASTVAAAAPERVRRLALIEGLGPLGGDAGAAGLRLREAIAARRAYEARAGEPPRRIPTMAAAVTARLMATPMRVEDAERIVDRNLQATEDGFAWRSDPRLRLPSTLRLNEEAVQSILRAIEAPTLLVAATPSPSYFTPAQRAARAACVRDLRVEVLEGGHHLHMEHPARVGALLRDFLAG
ncbi:MAG: alpha/beta fold hydrolase [Lysobacteraceae bacterium]|jgi:pimeloyl-ACP methyl ester carboxylesterase|nr:alpha/beta hydrolase [Xanthomonadaceae bacterium]MCZ8319281.1 alpha/beta hydrolase [Silanimonas sp.]